MYILDVVGHTQRLLNSYKRWTGRELIQRVGTPQDQSTSLHDASFVVVSHGTEENPIFNYGNKAALKLFGKDWQDFIQMPSINSAPSCDQKERAGFIEKVKKNGFATGYNGKRVTSSGRQFLIKDGTIWNVLDGSGDYCGQAATFSEWEFV